MLLKWFTQNCDKTQYVMKTDDDMYINLVRLYDLVKTNKKPNFLVGSLICNAIPIKDPYNKWYVPSYMFSAKKYPNYLSGKNNAAFKGREILILPLLFTYKTHKFLVIITCLLMMQNGLMVT